MRRVTSIPFRDQSRCTHDMPDQLLADHRQTMAKSGGKMVPDADQVKQILAGIAGQIDEANSLPPLLSLSVRPPLTLTVAFKLAPTRCRVACHVCLKVAPSYLTPVLGSSVTMLPSALCLVPVRLL